MPDQTTAVASKECREDFDDFGYALGCYKLSGGGVWANSEASCQALGEHVHLIGGSFIIWNSEMIYSGLWPSAWFDPRLEAWF